MEPMLCGLGNEKKKKKRGMLFSEAGVWLSSCAERGQVTHVKGDVLA